jgi:hypothetical protein
MSIPEHHHHLNTMALEEPSHYKKPVNPWRCHFVIDHLKFIINMTADMDIDMAIDMAIDMDVDEADDMDADSPCFHGPISSI